MLCAEDLATNKREALHAAADSGKVIFGVCGGYQLLGHAYELDGTKLPGVGLVDLETVREDGPRLIGNVAIEVDLDGTASVLAGFENHGGRTRLGAQTRPLGRVLKGHGNDGRSGYEGARGGAHGTVLGTYLHGPLLPKNAWFADWLTATALHRAVSDLEPLDDRFEDAAHAAARRAAGI
jgi:lipid II isoglutaminyl synthase (glutamine-hydrolysing)